MQRVIKTYLEFIEESSLLRAIEKVNYKHRNQVEVLFANG